MTPPGAARHPWWLILFAPVVGGLIVGLMARYGSEKIRGHGMPEAIDAILTGGSRVAPRVALLKPVSAAISIGTGGPFGAEGPIIMTGGAVGSILAQSLRLSADERKTLLVAGAAGGMAATFNAPLASVLLAVELLLFEWRPRRFIPGRRVGDGRHALPVGPARGGPRLPGHRRGPPWPGGDRAHAGAGRDRRAPRGRRHRPGVQVGGRVRQAARPLDVVAGDRRADHRPRRADRAAGARC